MSKMQDSEQTVEARRGWPWHLWRSFSSTSSTSWHL